MGVRITAAIQELPVWLDRKTHAIRALNGAAHHAVQLFRRGTEDIDIVHVDHDVPDTISALPASHCVVSRFNVMIQIREIQCTQSDGQVAPDRESLTRKEAGYQVEKAVVFDMLP